MTYACRVTQHVPRVTCHGILRTVADQGIAYHWTVISGNFDDSGSVIHLETVIDASHVMWIGVDHETVSDVCRGTGNHAACCHATGTATSAGTLIAPASPLSRSECPQAPPALAGEEGLACSAA